MKNYFSFPLYKQGIKRTRGIGIATVATTVVINFLSAFVTIQNAANDAELENDYPIIKMESGSIAPFLLFLCLFTPALCLSMFSYLNERKGADFYDSIPQKRVTIFTSFTAGIFTWIISALILSVTVNSVMWAISDYHSVSMGSALLLVLNYFISMMVLVGIILVCRSLSGKSSFALDFALSILFVPRLILSFFKSHLAELNPVVILEKTFLNNFSAYNSLWAIGGSAFSDSPSRLTRIPLLIGLFAEGALFLAFATYLYHKRESQVASKGVSSHRVKFFFRALLTLPLAFLIIITKDFVLLVVLITLTILLHFLYELFLSKNAKKALFSLPSLFIPFVVALALLLGAHISSNAFIKADPSVDEVESVYIHGNRGYTDEYNVFSNKTYVEKDSITSAVSALNKSYERADEPGSQRKYSRYEVEYTLKNGKKISRYVYFTNEELGVFLRESGFKPNGAETIEAIAIIA